MNHEQFNFMNVKEKAILLDTLEAFQKLTGGNIEILETEKREKDILYDIFFRLKIDSKEVTLYGDVKTEVRENILMNLKNQSKNYVLISRYIPSTIKSKLKEGRINYLEASGNCFIHTDKIFLYINDQKVTPVRVKSEGKLWKATGLKFLFLILVKEELLNASYRTISQAGNIALGSVGPLLEELKKEGYLKEETRNQKNYLYLQNKELLIKQWSTLYTPNLKPKLSFGKYRFQKSETASDWRKIKIDKIIWGNENAGAILTGYLDPENHTVYSSLTRTELMKKFMLVPDPRGNVELLEQFWSEEIQKNLRETTAVPPLLAYAELSASLDSRNQETAERIQSLING
jgi:hypothetical protein